MTFRDRSIFALGLFLSVSTLTAQTPTTPDNTFSPPCRGGAWWAESDATFEDFDFWVGEWQVIDRETGDLQGFDIVTKTLEGCVIHQEWRQLSDRASQPGAPWRYRGSSVTALNADGQWQQTWLDNAGSNILPVGQFEKDRTMVIESDWLAFTTRQGQHVKLKYRFHWQPQTDGTILNWGFMKQVVDDAPEGDWRQYFDIIYRRNAPGGPAPRVQSTEPRPSNG